jgi:membrane-associated protein
MFDLAHWVHAYGAIVGYLFVSGVIFAETGLFFGFFLPGDSILFPAGILASQGYLSIIILCFISFIAAVLGNLVGYYFGKHVGKRIFNRDDSIFFHKDHIQRAHAFYEKYGGKTIILARFVPVIRTFVPIVAGVSEMNFVEFFTFSSFGALLWAVGVPVAGFYLGRIIPNIDKFLLPIIAIVILLSIAPALIEIFKHKKNREKTVALFKYFLDGKKQRTKK